MTDNDFSIKTMRQLATKLSLALEGMLLSEKIINDSALSGSNYQAEARIHYDFYLDSRNQIMERLIEIFRNGRIT